MDKRASHLAPSKSTVYISNLPFSLTTGDLHKVLEKFGQIVKITIVKDKITRNSKGVAFILFLKVPDAQECAKKLDGCEMFCRTIKASIAKDNGRAAEFIRRREYPDKSRCYECGLPGHLSYACPNNVLGSRPRPRKRNKNGKVLAPNLHPKAEAREEDDDADSEVDNWSAAVRFQASLQSTSQNNDVGDGDGVKRPRIRPDNYFSDEECFDDE